MSADDLRKAGAAPPAIEPVPANTVRPRWSVMIPTYNCARYLEATLISVLEQAPEPAAMEIVVVDDVSTKDDPEAVVAGVGQGRVRFSRNPANLGVSGNFNRCLSLSRGENIHILHGDDFAMPGFYRKLGKAIEDHEDCNFFACRALIVDEEGVPEALSPRLPSLETPSNDATQFTAWNPFLTPSVVIRRRFYEAHGGFRTDLAHVADWDMWVRAIHRGRGVMMPQTFACYRNFAGNDTSRLARTAENLRDTLRLRRYFSELPGFTPIDLERKLREAAWQQAERFKALGDSDAYLANLQFFNEFMPITEPLRAGVAWNEAKYSFVEIEKLSREYPQEALTVDLLYRIILGRAADPDGFLHYVRKLAAGDRLQAIAAALLKSDEYTRLADDWKWWRQACRNVSEPGAQPSMFVSKAAYCAELALKNSVRKRLSRAPSQRS